MVVLCVFLYGFPKVALAERVDLSQALGFDGANELLRGGIRIGASHGKHHCLHAGGVEKLPERPCEQRIAIVDEEASLYPFFRTGLALSLGRPDSTTTRKRTSSQPYFSQIARRCLSSSFSTWLRSKPATLWPQASRASR